VSVDRVSKAFKLPHEQFFTLKERVLHPVRSRQYDLLEAVRDVSIEVGRGEFFGIVGRNGSGKSTLLKCIAGIYRKDTGSIRVRGRISPFIELGVGFSPELTARDNVMINAIMLGLTRREARERFDAIIDFAELRDFLDLKLKNYSSGMLVRLAFSAAIQVRTEVLLVDEVLAVGDANFQQKCFDQFKRLKDEGRTILFVTHDMGAVERFCDRAMLLDKGQMVEIGAPAGVARSYNRLNFARALGSTSAGARAPAPFGQTVDIKDGWFEDPAGRRVAESAYGDPCTIGVEVEFRQTIEDPIFGIALINQAGSAILNISSDQLHGSTDRGARPTTSGRFPADSRTVFRLRFDNWLAPGRYSLTASVAAPGLGAEELDLKDTLATIVVHSGPVTKGVVQFPHTFEIDRL
ncbi:MAG TPA: ABC transporter ATP-binding protein, partial [Solirubrobacteraceae bacterium]|nr:ABC transporter ATP-binding protein [Solirubrobacteraceae bacterium]